MDPLVTSIPSANLCKVLHNFVDICIRKQNFAEITPVHPSVRSSFNRPEGGQRRTSTLYREFKSLAAPHKENDAPMEPFPRKIADMLDALRVLYGNREDQFGGYVVQGARGRMDHANFQPR